MGGAISGALMTGSIEGMREGALWGAVSAGLAFGIGHAPPLTKLYNGAGALGGTIKASLHGLSRHAVSLWQHGSTKGAFASGFVSSLFGGMTEGMQNSGARIASNAVVGGTVSVIGGGKFANGAISSAFIMMFNEMGGSVAMNRKRIALLKGAKDGHLTLEEANNWWRYGRGKPLYVDGTRLKYRNTYGNNYAVTGEDYLVHGQVSINPENGRIFHQDYDFDMKSMWNPINWGRNFATIIGRTVAGTGTPFEIRYSYKEEWKKQ